MVEVTRWLKVKNRRETLQFSKWADVGQVGQEKEDVVEMKLCRPPIARVKAAFADIRGIMAAARCTY